MGYNKTIRQQSTISMNTPMSSQGSTRYKLQQLRKLKQQIYIFDLTHKKIYLMKIGLSQTVQDVYTRIKYMCLAAYPRGTMYKIHILYKGKVMTPNTQLFADQYEEHTIQFQVSVFAMPYKPIPRKQFPSIIIPMSVE